MTKKDLTVEEKENPIKPHYKSSYLIKLHLFK